MTQQRVLIIGASGGLGSRIRHQVNSHAGLTAVGASRGASYPDRRMDITDASSIAATLAGIDAVVVTAPQVRPTAQAVCAEHQIPCLDVTASTDLMQQAQATLDPDGTPSVMMGGLFPGFSGMLAAHAAAGMAQVSSLDIGVLQSKNAHVGATGTADMLRMISRPVTVRGREQPGFSQRRSMDIAGSAAQLRVVAYPEAQILAERFPGAEVEYCTAWDSPVLNGLMGLLSRMRILGRLADSTIDLRLPHRAGRPETIWLTAVASGVQNGQNTRRRATVQADSDYGATAKVTAALLQRLLTAERPPTGVVTPMDFLALPDVDHIFDGQCLRLLE